MNALKSFYEGIIYVGEKIQPYLLLVLRLYWGYQLYQAGLSKFIDPNGTAREFASLGIPFPLISAYLCGGVELAGGVALIAGFLTRLMAVPLIVNFIVAYIFAYPKTVMQIFSSPDKFIAESPFNFLLVSFIVLAFGPGTFSLDYFFERFVFKRKGGA